MMEKEQQVKKVKLKVWIIVIICAVIVYIFSYVLFSRFIPADKGVDEAGLRWYTFSDKDPDWEYTFYYFYYPLVKLDEAMGWAKHRFDTVYL
jgi:hypothetical protein